MVSLRFPFSFSQPTPPSNCHSPPLHTPLPTSAALAAVAAVGFGVGFAFSHKLNADTTGPLLRNPWHHFFSSTQNSSFPFWGSLSLAGNLREPAVEPKTGVSFPASLNDSQQLLGVGVRKKSVLGLKNIDVYAFGVYADDQDVKSLLGEKYGSLSFSELKENKDFLQDVLDEDLCMTVRLQIVYGRLSIRSVRSAFEESVGSRLQKFSGSGNKELLQKFTSQFKDEYKIPRGSIIDLSKERGYVLSTKRSCKTCLFDAFDVGEKIHKIEVDGKEVGSIQSKLLCRSILDLYVGDDPFDRHAKEGVELGLASILQKQACRD